MADPTSMKHPVSTWPQNSLVIYLPDRAGRMDTVSYVECNKVVTDIQLPSFFSFFLISSVIWFNDSQLTKMKKYISDKSSIGLSISNYYPLKNYIFFEYVVIIQHLVLKWIFVVTVPKCSRWPKFKKEKKKKKKTFPMEFLKKKMAQTKKKKKKN